MISNVNVQIHNTDNFRKSMEKNFSSIGNTTELSITTPLGETHLRVGWRANEEESKLLRCYCSVDPWQASSVRNWQHSVNDTYCEISNISFDHGTKVFVSIKCINAIQLAGEETVGPFTIYHMSPKAERASLSFYPGNRYTVLEMQPKVQVQSNLTHVDFTWDGFEDAAEILSYETRLWKGDIIIAPWRSVGFRNSAQRKTPNTEKGDTILLEVRAINNGGYKSQVINTSIVLDNRPPALTGLPASYHASKGSYNIKWPNVFSPSLYGSTIYLISAGSSVGSSDILSPVSTMAEEINLEWTHDTTQHEIFVNILAFAANGEFSRYKTKFFVK
uniref:Uncharacterized protein LOC111126310 n=1 Tax=Crassostrea virginica TaxID=6565 RepID=A0A8B8DHV7_CRAVI|nr:uncharacterized protein LOC111126310 [Crassostrea virginica]